MIERLTDDHSLAWSPNYDDRPAGVEPSCTVVHFTAGGSAHGTARWVQTPGLKVSFHSLISRTGHRYDVVPPSKRAWHAGVSEWWHAGEMTWDVNDFSLGVELANHGLLIRKGDQYLYELGGRLYPYDGPEPQRRTLVYDSGATVSGWWEPYPQPQIDGLKRLLDDWSQHGYDVAASNLVGHEEITFAGRKRDPGPLFPWHQFGRRPERTKSTP